jgi:hypothetical protein
VASYYEDRNKTSVFIIRLGDPLSAERISDYQESL